MEAGLGSARHSEQFDRSGRALGVTNEHEMRQTGFVVVEAYAFADALGRTAGRRNGCEH